MVLSVTEIDLLSAQAGSQSTTADAPSDAGTSGARLVSADGRFVTFNSGASDIVAGDSNGLTDIFLVDRTTGSAVKVSSGLVGANANGSSILSSISSDGKFVGFQSSASLSPTTPTDCRMSSSTMSNPAPT